MEEWKGWEGQAKIITKDIRKKYEVAYISLKIQLLECAIPSLYTYLLNFSFHHTYIFLLDIIQLLEYPIPAAAHARHKNRQVPISRKPRVVS